jgi:dynein heavy chain, axonemal
VDEILEKLPEEFNMAEIMGKVEERTPYVIVAFQECERMNYLTNEMKRSLRELDLGLKVLSSNIFELVELSGCFRVS